MAVFACSQCGHSQAVDEKYVGKTATCPKCKTPGVVREANEAPVRGATPDPSVGDTQRVLHATKGPLGIACDTWMDSQRHINRRSALRVEWWTAVEDTMPVFFTKPCGLQVHNVAADYPLDIIYQAETIVQCRDEPVAAFEVRYLTFNVWAEHVSTLRAVEILDINAGAAVRKIHTWNLYSDNEAEEFCASLGFVSRVRLASGTVRNADYSFVLREAKRFSEKFTEEDLEPKAPKRT